MLRWLHTYRLIFPALLAVLLNACGSSSPVGTATTDADIQKAIDSSNWVFTANQVMPVSGRTRQVNGNYTVVYKGQKLEVYLPYFGRATTGADVLSGRSPLDFSTGNPAIDQQQVKPGEWRIQLRPDNPEVQVMDFTFYANGTAYLAVRMNSRSGINYNGTVRPLNRQ